MMKIIMSLMVVVGVAFGYTSEDVVGSKDTATISIDNGLLFLYNRQEFSLKNQDEYKIGRNLRKNLCSNPVYKKSINEGTAAHFIYMYKDGTIAISVSECY